MDTTAKTPITVVILADGTRDVTGFLPALAPVATLPLVLRIALTAQKLNVGRTVLCVTSEIAPHVHKALDQCGRVPKSLEWFESARGMSVQWNPDLDSELQSNEPNTCSCATDLAEVARRIAPEGNLIVVAGDRSYHPSLLSKAVAWDAAEGALCFRDNDEPVGIVVLSNKAAKSLAAHVGPVSTIEGLHRWLSSNYEVKYEQVADQSWQRICSRSDQYSAEKKLNQWLVKPTDGMFARMNRRVSIPISRSIVHLPITPNMVTMFTLWVSFGAGLFFAHGGYWATLVGAMLSVAASILDGCDGEVARLKLQVTDFGCWLETVCDYLYYVFVFGGMIAGFARTMGARFALTWGTMLLFGAAASFLSVAFARHHFAADRPEAFLSIWQRKAERRKSNPLLFLGRYTEFIIRRCFLPYAFLGFALLNVLPVAFVTAAIGSNIVWPIALYSCFTLSARLVPTQGAAITT